MHQITLLTYLLTYPLTITTDSPYFSTQWRGNIVHRITLLTYLLTYLPTYYCLASFHPVLLGRAQLAPSAVTAGAVGGPATRGVVGRLSPTRGGVVVSFFHCHRRGSGNKVHKVGVFLLPCKSSLSSQYFVVVNEHEFIGNNGLSWSQDITL